MNIVLIMTDTQPTDMVGCYSGNPAALTPNIDRLASRGIRFDRAYTACPLCTPARSALFSGTHAPVNGAWANSMAPGSNFPLMGTVFSELGYRCAYTGKWHLDGTSYFGDGEPGGGFAGEWWFDGKNYAEHIGPEKFAAYRRSKTSAELRAAGFGVEDVWGRHVADRAIDFLSRAGGDGRPFLLVVSFDEPHGPYVTPPGEWEEFDVSRIALRENFQAPLEGKPALQRQARAESGPVTAERHREGLRRAYACNRYVDGEIGRVLEAVDRHHAEDTLIVYTSDHGDMQHSHGLVQKGPFMYEEAVRIPLIVRPPSGRGGRVCPELVSHADVMPTLLELAGAKIPGILHGQSFAPQLREPSAPGRDALMVDFTRFALNHDGWGGFYPIRCLITRTHKLAVNLLDRDELYARDDDPDELHNLIDDPSHAATRDAMHDRLLAEMNRIRDPFRGAPWGNRAWRRTGGPDYFGGTRRHRPSVFPFQPACIDADGSRCGTVDDYE